MRFHDRAEAGRLLGHALEHYRDQPEVLVLALPRGGVPVAFEIAQILNAPLDIFMVRKLGVPGHEELAMGAIATGGLHVLNDSVIQQLGIPQYLIEATMKREEEELHHRENLYRGNRPPSDFVNRIVIIVDDGLATGATMRVAVTAIRRQRPAKIVIAVPVADAEICREMKAEADEVICTMTPEDFYAVGHWYEDFGQTTDEEVAELIRSAGRGCHEQ